MGTAALLWLFVLVYLMQFEGVPAKTFVSAIFFVVFFGVSLTYYARTAIVVDGGGVTYRGLVRTDYFAFRDILKVDILPGPVTVYAVRGRGPGDALHELLRPAPASDGAPGGAGGAVSDAVSGGSSPTAR